ncbi:MAG: right-handed parallel beta-helix repeat-containing protein [Rubricoccaceae bacterium]|nr:right-handed parallel beta-helix repeat-containing protein [Rubricoccaceae bacterium]
MPRLFTALALASCLLLALAAEAHAQLAPAGDAARAEQSARAERLARLELPDELSERVERYTYDPHTGRPTLTPEAAAAYFARHAARRAAAQAEAARRAGDVDGTPLAGPPPAATGGEEHTAFTFTVTTAFDSGDTNPGDGVCQASGFLTGCTLRAAIEEANATPSTLRVTIEFAIGFGPGGSDLGGGAWRIQPSTVLPAITRENTTLDALTQDGAQCGGLIGGVFQVPHTLKVVLDGSLIPFFFGSMNGLSASSLVSNIDIRGFVVRDFPGYGVVVGGPGSEVACNYIGMDRGGTERAPNFDGVLVGGVLSPPGAVVVENNLISGNDMEGVLVTRDAAEVRGNLVGTDETGASGFAGFVQRTGILVSGDDVVVDGNVASGNLHGISLASTEDGFGGVLRAERAVVTNNYVGLSRRGLSTGVGNAYYGVSVRSGARDNDIGLPGSGNTLGDNGYAGVVVSDIFDSGTRDNRIRGNTAGLDADGVAAPNRSGIEIVDGASTTVQGNTLSGNLERGLYITPYGRGAVVEDNRIGTDPTGTEPRPNAFGIEGFGVDSVIRGNTISGNTQTGVITGVEGSGAVFESNFIGTNAAGDDLGNGWSGILCSGDNRDIRIGGTAAPNTIAFNGVDGVTIDGNSNGVCHDASIVGNRIYANVDLGIELDMDGPTPNDPGDADAGPNGLQNYPLVTRATNDGTDAAIAWTLDSTPNTSFELLFCRLSAPDPSGYGECEDPAAAVTATTDAQGYASGTLSQPASTFPVGDWVSASATVVEGPLPEGYGATSEFSPAVQVEVPVPAFTATLVPTSPTPVVLQRGDYLFFDVVFEVGPTGPSSFEFWTEAVLPNGTVRSPLLGPSTVTVTPPQTVTLSFSQRVPNIAPFGSYTYRLEAGTFPGTILDQDAFPLEIVSGLRAGSDGGSDNWQAFDASGAPLAVPQVYDFRTASAEGEPVAAAAGRAASQLEGLPGEPTFSAAYPNPFRTSATIGFALPEAQRVRLAVYDVLGREVAVLADGELAAGWHEAVLDGAGLPSGLYLVRLEAGTVVQTRRLTLAR